MQVRIKEIITCLLILFCLNNCSKQPKRERIVRQWIGKEIKFPNQTFIFSISNKSFNKNKPYKILKCIDPEECVSCNLHLYEWKNLIKEMDSTPILIYVLLNDIASVEIKARKEQYDYPIYIDKHAELKELNKLRDEPEYRTFLLDSTNRVIAIGDPVQNPEIKRLYLNIITGKAPSQKEEILSTTILLDKPSIDFGVFPWKEEQKAKFIIKNTGNESLVIKDIITSCDCTTVSYKKEPVPPNESLEVEITFKAEHPEVFERDITVYCNADNAPVEVTVKGEAK